MLGKSTHLQVILQQRTQKPANLILLCDTGVKFSLRNIVVNSGFFAKVSILVKIYNSLLSPRNYRYEQERKLLHRNLS